MTTEQRQSGVIMLEALMGLILFVMVGAALININGQASRQQRLLHNTQCAGWLAQNLLTQELLTPPMRALHDERGVAIQCDKEWQWLLMRRATNDRRFYLITLEIRNGSGSVQLERQILRAW